MPSFSQESEQQLAHVHPDVVDVLRVAIKFVDFKVLCGLRDKAAGGQSQPLRAVDRHLCGAGIWRGDGSRPCAGGRSRRCRDARDPRRDGTGVPHGNAV